MISATILDLLSLAVRWIPIRFSIVDTTEQGVRWWWGKDTKLLEHGVYVYVPWLGDITTTSCLPQIVETETQCVETTDGKSIAMSVCIHYRIRDARKWTTGVEDFDGSLCNLVQLHLYKATSGRTSNQLREQREEIIALTKRTAQRVAGKWGVEIIQLDFITCTSARTIQLLSTNNTVREA